MLLPFLVSLLLTSAAHAAGNHHGNEYLKLELIHIHHSTSPSHTLLLDTHRLHSLHHHIHNRPSLKSPLVSGASVGAGQYYAGISIGTPPQNLLLVADTGSDLTWVKCSACRLDCADNHSPGSAFLARHSASFRNVPCSDPHCRLVPHPTGPTCHAHSHAPCKYEYSYADGSTTSGFFSLETASFNSSSGQNIRIQGLKLGCGVHVSGPSVTPAGFEGAAGVMGLGRGPISFAAQLGKKFGNKFSYCLMDYTLSPPPTSYLVIGSTQNDVVSGNRNNQVQSTPLIHSALSPTFYYIGIKSVSIDGERLPISPAVWALDDSGNGGTVVDTGTTLTFLPSPAYAAIVKEMRKRVKLPRVSELTQGALGFDLCYNVSMVDDDKDRPHFPKMEFELEGGSVFDPPARNYFIRAAEGVTCLAVQPVGSQEGFAVIGNLMQQGFLFGFDNDKSRLLFSKGCHLHHHH